jgi:iron(III) transport system permease protein
LLSFLLPTSRQWLLLLHTLLFALLVSAGTLAVGIPAATAIWCSPRFVQRSTVWLAMTLVAVPSLVHWLAWTAAVDAANAVLHQFGLGLPPFSGWAGAWWVEVMAYLPLAVALAYVGLASVDPLIVAAARMNRADSAVYFRILLPLAGPQILAAGGLVFALSLTDYGIPSLFQKSVYALEVYVVYSGGACESQVLLLGIPLMLLAVVGVAGPQAGLRAAVARPLWGNVSRGTPLAWPFWLRTLTGLGLALMLAQVTVPVIGLLVNLGSWCDLITAAMSAHHELLTTFWVSLLAGAACCPLALAAADLLSRGGAGSRVWWFLMTAPLAVPPPLVGVGLLGLCRGPGVGLFSGTLTLPILAATARFAPAAALVMVAQQRRVDPLLFDAARVHQRSTSRAWIQVLLPMLAPGMLAGGGIAAALTAGELGATLLVAPPGHATLAMRIYSYLHCGAAENAAGLCLITALGTLSVGLLVLAGSYAWKQLFPRAGERSGEPG